MLTNEQFVQKANLIHNNKYNYDKVLYKNSKSKVCIICPEHGEFWQIPNSHLRGVGCPNCGGSKRLTTEQFIERSKSIHGDTYDYSKVEYYNFKSPITIVCPIHGDFIQVAGNHLTGNGCYKCRSAKISKHVRLTTDEFIQKAKLVHGNLYDYSKTNYIGADSDVLIICKKHGEFLQNAHSHLRGHGCQKCCLSKGEQLISEFLSDHQLKFTPQFCITDIKFQNYAKIDFMVMFNSKQYFIEYNGVQHYQSVEQFGGREALARVKSRDDALVNYCKENNINLLVFRYDQTKEEIISQLNDIFSIT